MPTLFTNVACFCYLCIVMDYKAYTQEAVSLLCRLIATPSFSREESAAADIMEEALRHYGFQTQRAGNNVWTSADTPDANRPTLLLNAHIDTVRPAPSWRRDPFAPTIEGDRLYGLGSNDCGGGLMALLQTLRICRELGNMKYNIIYLASAEEEVSGAGGFSMALPLLPNVDVAIVGEPTGMQPAIAERGLMVVDCEAHGIAGHAARNEGVNAIYIALDDIQWLRHFSFPKVSPLLGACKTTVTIINGGTQHNVVPDKCSFLIDVRTNELYTNQEVFEILKTHMKSSLKERSFRLGSSRISAHHPIVERCVAMGMTPFGSPTLSDQALMPFPSLKLGPGQSSRSHSADEFICISEIENAIATYVALICGI